MFNLTTFHYKNALKVVIQNEAITDIRHLILDSRNIMYPSISLYFALKGNVHDGHLFIPEAYQQGVRNFVVSDEKFVAHYTDINYILTKNVIETLQYLASNHRNFFPDLISIGITGSNGKTMVKEWLAALLSKKYSVIKSPGSYNSQIGVALSVWQIGAEHQIGIFEAGISAPHEMENLEHIIKPKMGIFTNLGDAHDSGFSSRAEKLNEKLKLFTHSTTIIFNGDDDVVNDAIQSQCKDKELWSWGRLPHNKIIIQKLEISGAIVEAIILWENEEISFHFNISQGSILENAMHCLVCALSLGFTPREIENGLQNLVLPDLRLSISDGRDGSLIVNDTYTLDFNALKMAIDFTFKHGISRKKYLVLSEEEKPIHSQEIITYLKRFEFEKIFLVGSSWKFDSNEAIIVEKTEDLMPILENEDFDQGIILIKGARKFGLEQVAVRLSLQQHSASLDIDLKAVEHNLSTFASKLTKGAQIIPIIKASAYGSGSDEIAKLLQHKGIKMLGVAFADEAVRLRKSGIVIPIIVLNPDENSFVQLADYHLDFEVYSLLQLKAVLAWKNGKLSQNRLHLKLDTGMSRLGFQEGDIAELRQLIKDHDLKIGSIFSHLSSSEDSNDDDFSHLQAARFSVMYEEIVKVLGYRPMRHILNSSGILRFPQYHYEAVRLGLGLYGIDSTLSMREAFEKVHTLKARIIQIKSVKAGNFIGYNRKHKAEKDMVIGILNIGYADGFIRLCGNGRYEVMIHKTKCKVIGNVCMDLSIVDLTGHDHIKPGDEVIIFGKHHAIETMAHVCQTIPYEILTRIAPRVKRNYVY